MDGLNSVNLLKEKVFYPTDLSLDVTMKKIYLLDHYFDFIQQCDYDGSNRKFLQKVPLMKFHRIAFFEDMFYGAVNKNLSVVQFSKSSSTFKKILAENLDANPKMVKVFHQQTQPQKVKVCGPGNKCEHLCIPVEGNVEKCLCREGFKLDNGACKLRDSKEFLMFVDDNPSTLKAVEVDGSGDQVIAPIIGLKSNIAFDVDLNQKRIYFTSYSNLNSSETNVIESQSFNGENRTRLEGNFGAIQSMAIDFVGGNLFFTSQSPNAKIAAVKLGKSPAIIKTLVSKNLIGPSSLALDPQNGELNSKFPSLIHCPKFPMIRQLISDLTRSSAFVT
jgi:hypothetical protein